MDRNLGDFQTPLELVHAVLAVVQRKGWTFDFVIEPACGIGNFIEGIHQTHPSVEVVGVELDADYVDSARRRFQKYPNISIFQGDALTSTTFEIAGRSAPVLILGNPPWVTNSGIGCAGSPNCPKKENRSGIRGIDAITGSSNFDISEWILLSIFEAAKGVMHVAVLCKTSVARRVVAISEERDWNLSGIEIRRIDAARWFSVSADACLFLCSLNAGDPNYTISDFPALAAEAPERLSDASRALRDVVKYESVSFLEGGFHVEWRQGIKHDAASVMELIRNGDVRTNGNGERVEIEDDFVFPLFKSSDIGGSGKMRGKREVIVTQRFVGEDTISLSDSTSLGVPDAMF